MLCLTEVIRLDVLLEEEPLFDYGSRTSRITNTILMEGTNFPLGLVANDALFVTDE